MPATSEKKIYLRQAQIGPMANFVYLVGDPKTRKLAVVDPAWDVEAIRKFAETEGYDIDKILITHYHPDHLGGHMMGQQIEGAAEMLHKVKAKVYVHKEEAPFSNVRKVSIDASELSAMCSGDMPETSQSASAIAMTMTAPPRTKPHERCDEPSHGASGSLSRSIGAISTPAFSASPAASARHFAQVCRCAAFASGSSRYR